MWVHLAGLATVPLWIDLCLLGLAVGNPTLPELELGVIVALGVLPVLVMQLRQPFYIFSLPGLALKPGKLQDDQRCLLSQFRRWRVRLGALLVPVPLVWVLLKLYPLAFLARDLTPFSDWGRLGGVAIAVLSFLMANLFVQIPIAVLQVLATPNRVMARVVPYPLEGIATDFTWIGLAVSKMLPDLANQPRPEIAAPAMVEIPEPHKVLPIEALDTEPKGSVAEAMVDTEVSLEHAVVAGATEVLAAHVNASDVPNSTEAIAVAVDPEDPKDRKDSVTADPVVDTDAAGAHRPLRHPEVDESSYDITHLDDADYSQSLSAIADIYPKAR
ncbi:MULTISPECIES: low-complexity tail membrane protein [Cyanophyceae]|uniref:low-complexity tail membrane protein n=1 Tax=Cyanophyceae TaxID=3028117 RepID=UPI0024113DFC|nr:MULTISPECIES: low-complexity tail membrane protein [Cyanophyceae]